VVPFESLGIVSYSPSYARNCSRIFSHFKDIQYKEWRDLENGIENGAVR